MQQLGPVGATVGEVIAVGDQGLAQLAAQQGDPFGAFMVSEPVASHADLVGAGGAQGLPPQIGPLTEGLTTGTAEIPETGGGGHGVIAQAVRPY